MRAPLSKIAKPRLPIIYARKRLFRLLDHQRNVPVTWITGPAGSGKTTLVASYLDVKKLPCLWYQMDEGDSDIASFFYYMGLAAKKAAPRVRRPLPLLTPEYQFGIPTFTRRFFEELFGRLNSFTVIVFDNYQKVPGGSLLHDVVLQGLSELPAGIKAVIISRSEPQPLFARMHVNKAMETIGWEQLRFTPQETSGAMKLHSGKALSKEKLRQIYEKTQGWAAGVVLMEASRARPGEENEPDRMVPGKLSDYFAGEIFDKLDREMRDFLLKTSYLARMTPRMAGALTGNSNAGRILSDLNRNNYFTERRAEQEPSYQFHALFREFLRKRVEQEFPEATRSQLRLAAAKLLEESGQIEDAAELYRESREWPGLIQVVLNHAQSFVTQGRASTLEKWLTSVPLDIREQIPWLMLWMGACRLPFNPAEARTHFEKAFDAFKAEKTPIGLFLSWCGVMDTVLFEWNGFTLMDRWIEEMDVLTRQYPAFPSAEIEARVTNNMFSALLFRQPSHPDFHLWEARMRALLRNAGDPSALVIISTHLMLYYIWIGDFSQASMVFKTLSASVRQSGVSPLALVTWKTVEAYYSFWVTASAEDSLKAISEGLQTAQTSGVHVWDFTLLTIGAYNHFAAGNHRQAETFQENMSAFLPNQRRFDVGHYNYAAAWGSLMKGDLPRALEQGNLFMQIVEEGGAPFLIAFDQIAMAQVLFANGKRREADEYLERAGGFIRSTRSHLLEYKYLLAKSQFSFQSGKERSGLDYLREAMSLGREKRFFAMDWWLPAVMTTLCMKALEHGIEEDYVRDLIRKRNLVPDEPLYHIENWPWPIKINTLGRFELLKDGKPVRSSGKVQKKPLEMLKALIAFGGRDVQGEQIATALWPDADGDAAYKAFGITLIRLRELLGVKDAVQLSEGNVTLDHRYFWVDAWAFEKNMERADRVGVRDGNTVASVQNKSAIRNRQSEIHLGQLEKAVNLYRGPFLTAESAPWAISLRERLRDKFLRCISASGMYWEQNKEWDKAIDCYKKGLEADDLVEEFYRRIILCHQRLGHNAEALSAYNRCKKTLASYGIELSSETKALLRKD